MRKLLFPFSVLYDAVTRLRNGLYANNIFKPFQFDIVTIGVGNLSVGGTGKSPHVDYLIELLKNEYSVATLSRGYGRKSKGFVLLDKDMKATQVGDEPLMFKRKYPNIPVAVAENRVLGVVELLSREEETNLVILDDVFQHRAIHPHIQILLTPFDDPFFNDLVLPAGNLRESRKGAERADIIIVTKCSKQISQQQKLDYASNLKKYNKTALVCFSYLEYGAISSVFHNEERLENFDSILAFAGIANPNTFFGYLEEKGVLNTFSFKDHHSYTLSDLEKMKSIFNNKKWVCTEKDAVKLLELRSWFETNGISLYYLPLQVRFTDTAFDTFIKENVASINKLILES